MGNDANTQPEVKVEPSGRLIGVRSGEPVMLAAHRQGYHWPNICGGQAICGVCQVRVLEGIDNIDPASSAEQVRLRTLGRSNDPATRLACQMTVTGPVTVFKRGVKNVARGLEDVEHCPSS